MKIKNIIETLFLGSSLFIFLAVTNPNNVPLMLLLVPYVLFGLIAYRLFNFFLAMFFAGQIKTTKLKIYSLILTVLTVNFTLLQSLGQITVQDWLISAAIMAVSVMYISKFSLGKQ